MAAGNHVVRWFGFGASNALMKSTVHFFPSSGDVSAPYPATCRLTVFGQGRSSKTVALEGARLSQPDGVRCEDIFPELGDENSNFFGIELEITSPQPKLDLSASACVIELGTRSQSTRYAPLRVGENAVTSQPTLLVKDALTTTSIVVVNASAEPFDCDLGVTGASVREVPARSVEELAISDQVFDSVQPQQCSFGLLRARRGFIRAHAPLQGIFVLYRDAVNKRPMSVMPLI